MRLAVLGLLSLTGCATLFAGGPDHVPVSTNPSGATVFVDGAPVGQTPMVLTLDRQHNSGVLRIELPGFAPVTLVREKGINGWFWANLCIGIIPMIIDAMTGDMKEFDDTPIAIGLTPLGGYPGGEYPPQGSYPPGYAQPGYAQPPQGYAPPPPNYPPAR